MFVAFFLTMTFIQTFLHAPVSLPTQQLWIPVSFIYAIQLLKQNITQRLSVCFIQCIVLCSLCFFRFITPQHERRRLHVWRLVFDNGIEAPGADEWDQLGNGFPSPCKVSKPWSDAGEANQFSPEDVMLGEASLSFPVLGLDVLRWSKPDSQITGSMWAIQGGQGAEEELYRGLVSSGRGTPGVQIE